MNKIVLKKILIIHKVNINFSVNFNITINRLIIIIFAYNILSLKTILFNI